MKDHIKKFDVKTFLLLLAASDNFLFDLEKET